MIFGLFSTSGFSRQVERIENLNIPIVILHIYISSHYIYNNYYYKNHMKNFLINISVYNDVFNFYDKL